MNHFIVSITASITTFKLSYRCVTHSIIQAANQKNNMFMEEHYSLPKTLNCISFIKRHIRLLHPKGILWFYYISYSGMSKTPIFIFARSIFSTSAISMSLRISLFLCLNPSQYCLNRALTQKGYNPLLPFFFCRLLTLNTILKVIRLSAALFSHILYIQ